METIGLIAAMPQECEALLRLLPKRPPAEHGPYRVYRFQLLDRECLLIRSGMGLIRARDAARYLINRASPQVIVSFGIAGAVQADLEIGDVIAANQVCIVDNGALGQFQPLACLSDAARQAAGQALLPSGARLLSGTAITTHGSQMVNPGGIPHPVLDMETAAIALVAAGQGIPLLALRAVSDGPRAPLPLDIETIMDAEFNLDPGKMIKTVLRHPTILFKSMVTGRNVAKAARNAAIATLSALGQPLPILLRD